MRDGTTSLESFLTAASEGTPILITGHSLGGCLASALAPCVADWRGSAIGISVYTIAAPSPGKRISPPTTTRYSLINQATAPPFASSTAWMWYPMLGQASPRSRHITHRWSPAPRTSTESLAAPKQPWLGSTANVANLRWGAQSRYPAPSSCPSVHTEVAWSPMPLRMHCFCGKPPNNMPARRIRHCCKHL